MPAASWPRMHGKRPSGSSPPSVYASVWHSAVATILTRTSSLWGGATWTSQISSGFFASQAIAALHVITLPAVSEIAAILVELECEVRWASRVSSLDFCICFYCVVCVGGGGGGGWGGGGRRGAWSEKEVLCDKRHSSDPLPLPAPGSDSSTEYLYLVGVGWVSAEGEWDV